MQKPAHTHGPAGTPASRADHATETTHREPRAPSSSPVARNRSKWVFFGFLAISAFFLLAEHRAHLLGFLPWLILLACPLMHLFMHGGHGHGGHGSHGGTSGKNDGTGDPR